MGHLVSGLGVLFQYLPLAIFLCGLVVFHCGGFESPFMIRASAGYVTTPLYIQLTQLIV